MTVDLVERARTGDHDAFSRLVQLDGDRCYAIAIGILRDRDRAQDAVQQAFMLAWRDLPQLRDAARFEPWLHRLLVRTCYQEARRHRRWSIHVMTLPVEGPDEPGKRRLDRLGRRAGRPGTSLRRPVARAPGRRPPPPPHRVDLAGVRRDRSACRSER